MTDDAATATVFLKFETDRPPEAVSGQKLVTLTPEEGEWRIEDIQPPPRVQPTPAPEGEE